MAVLQANGLTPAHVVKTNVFLVRMDDFAAMNEAYAKVFTADFPARSAVAVHQLPIGAVFESRPGPTVGTHRDQSRLGGRDRGSRGRLSTVRRRLGQQGIDVLPITPSTKTGLLPIHLDQLED